MPENPIPLEHLSDRELILLTASTVNTFTKDHEERLRSLEKWRWGLAGAWAVISAFLTAWLGIHTAGHK